MATVVHNESSSLSLSFSLLLLSLSDESTQDIFRRQGMTDGLYLLRESRSQDHSYILSLAHKQSIKHYMIGHVNGSFALANPPSGAPSAKPPSPSSIPSFPTLSKLLSYYIHIAVRVHVM